MSIIRLAAAFLLSLFKSRRRSVLDNLALRQQVTMLRQSVKKPRPFMADKLFWILFSRYVDGWRQILQDHHPDTVVRWHRQGFRLYWGWKSRRRGPGRPAIDIALCKLIREMQASKLGWGAPRIHGELRKLGLEVSQATVSNYMVQSKKPPSQTWRTFIANHADCLAAMDFFTVSSARFRVLFVFVGLSHDRRKVEHFNATEHPTAQWTAQQLFEAYPSGSAPRYLSHDRDAVYGEEVKRRVRALGIEEVITAPRLPWQNAYVERVIGSIRREYPDHVIVLNEQHLKRVLRDFFDYCHICRTLLPLNKNPPEFLAIEPVTYGNIVALPRVGGLHHRYTRAAA
jgi:transposase InsO family protein